ncbi:replication endonuclease [Massilia sp. Root335]|uniref:replication endonuclease n=1 Tax=Massilia sp. Root335 TaxID=1736517 RepID=UPI0009E6A71F|nr:replication endonuclease [Massilia sp. Root335]
MNWKFNLHPSHVGEQCTGDEAAIKKASGKFVFSSRRGVVKLLASYREEQLSILLKQRYGRNVQTEDEIPAYVRREDAEALDRIRLEVDKRVAAIIETEGKIANYIDFDRSDIRQLAVRLAEHEYRDPADKIRFAEALLGAPIPGASLESQHERTCTAMFWRRALTVRVSRAREQFFLRLGLIGRNKERYSSSLSVDAREQQLYAQEKWMRETVLVPGKVDNDNNDVTRTRREISLSDVVKRPEHKFAKLYTFVKGMESLGDQQKLASAMVTITLDPRWHPNPLHGKKKWNGKSPREAHKSFCKGWQAVMRDLDRHGIKLSGLRVVEPHRDACPHYHIWLLYRPEHETKILLAIMRYFPLGLKVRTPGAGQLSDKDEIYENRLDLAAGAPRTWRGIKDKFQVEFSRIVRKLDANGERRACSSASYVMKYLMKTLPANVRKPSNKSRDGAGTGKSSDEVEISRVDAFRSVWGINQGQLFGIAKCLTIWDELRRIQNAPEHPLMKDLWKKARGGEAVGRVEKCSEQKGDAHAFLEALGGLDAARNGKRNGKRLVVARLVEEVRNRYGDVIKRTTGIRLLEKERKKVKKVDSKGKAVRYGWKIFTEVVVSIATKVEKWKFEKKRSNLFNLDKKSTAAGFSTA